MYAADDGWHDLPSVHTDNQLPALCRHTEQPEGPPKAYAAVRRPHRYFLLISGINPQAALTRRSRKSGRRVGAQRGASHFASVRFSSRAEDGPSRLIAASRIAADCDGYVCITSARARRPIPVLMATQMSLIISLARKATMVAPRIRSSPSAT